MKLSIGNQPIAIPEDANISLEKSSPVLGSDATAFSYPFPVPRIPNHQGLGWPGKLERTGEIPDKTFILEDQGIQILVGEVEFDDTDDNEIGVILKSGMTEFWAKIKDVKMPDIDFGSETWLTAITSSELIAAKYTEWDADNAAENAPVVRVPFLIDNDTSTAEILGNTWYMGAGSTQPLAFMLQFRAWHMIEKVFEHFGYTVTANALKTSEWAQLIVFTKPFYFAITPSEEDPAVLWVFPSTDTLTYSGLMPDITVQDFLDGIKSTPGLVFSIDDRTKEVIITLLRDLFLPDNIDLMEITELKGWQHRESVSTDGYQLAYQGQDDENDTKTDYLVNQTVEDTLPTPTSEGTIIHVTSVNRDYIVMKKAVDSSLYWSMIGRLKPYTSGNGGLKIEFNVKVPQSHQLNDNLWPYIPIGPSRKYDQILWLLRTDMSELYISLFRGFVTIGGSIALLICAEKYAPDVSPSLEPIDLNTISFEAYSTWKSTTARGFTKYIQLTLPQLMALQWGKRYFISGVRVVLEKINYDVPFTGIVKVDGYTA
ncbi:MAG: hypothetical protein WCK35_02835 [Chloroflexota bacterium]